jgi:UDP-GlcNAc:undecaprenyl-phosphate GlcNAc-1-phosphate transferase
MSIYLNLTILPLTISLLLTPLIILLAKKINLLDIPKGERKLHRKPIPLMGGLAIFFSFFIITFLNLDKIISDTVEIKFIIAMFIGALVIMIGGFLDDKYDLKPKYSIIPPIIASLVIVLSGLKIEYITNPFGGSLFIYPLLGVIITFLWVLGMMYTTKILDGLDGLVTGITTIGAVIIFLASFQKYFIQPEVAILTTILTGTCLGFLFWNFHQAKIFLGEGGSLLCGFLLACLAILAKGKIATALLIVGIPILDLIWVMIRRLRENHSIKIADRKHLHHRLLDYGFSHRGAVLVYYAITIFFGVSALLLQSKGKIFALFFLVIFMAIIAEILTGKRNIKK